MEKGLFGFFVVDMAANTANGVNFSVGNSMLVPVSLYMGVSFQSYRFAIFCVND